MNFTGERVVPGQMHRYITTLQEHMARYNMALKAALNKKVLDAACGAGYGSELLMETAKEVVGVDVSPAAIAYAIQKYKKANFIVCDLEKKFPRGKFDLCVSFETIEHLTDPTIFLTNVAKNCKEFLFSIPLNNPSQFHKTVWTKEQVVKTMGKYWKNITWYNQRGMNFYQGSDDATFLIGYALNSKLK